LTFDNDIVIGNILDDSLAGKGFCRSEINYALGMACGKRTFPSNLLLQEFFVSHCAIPFFKKLFSSHVDGFSKVLFIKSITPSTIIRNYNSTIPIFLKNKIGIFSLDTRLLRGDL